MEKEEKVHKSNVNKSEIFTKVIAGLMAILMLSSAFVTGVYYIYNLIKA